MKFDLKNRNNWQFLKSLETNAFYSLQAPFQFNYLLLIDCVLEIEAVINNNIIKKINNANTNLALNFLSPRALTISLEHPFSCLQLEGDGWELCQLSSLYIAEPELVTFDMDSTLICEEVIDEIARDAGCYQQVSSITESAMRGELDFSQSLIQRVRCLKGLSEKNLDEIAKRLTLSPGAKRLLQQLHRLNIKTAILSGGFDFFAKKIAQQLGIEIVVANQLEIRSGVLTGEVFGGIVDSEVKARKLFEIAQQYGIDPSKTVAVGDGANDLKVLSKAALGIAWHAQPAVAKEADLAINSLGLDSIGWLWEASS